jgi:thiosulfate dehydrogenase (quinone) large subunit
MNDKPGSVLAFNANAAASGLLRLGLGMLLFFAGLNKFLGPGPSGVSKWMAGEFSETYLPGFLVAPYAYALPFIEVAVGFLLVIGLFTRATLVVCGFLLLSLALGKMVLQDHDTVSHILNYVLITAVALWFASRDNRYSVDGLVRARQRK